MRYALPATKTLSMVYEDVVYAVNYYLPAKLIEGVVDENYRLYTQLTTTPASAGEYIIVPELKRIYRSSADVNATFPPANPTTWVDYGPVNSYRMFANDEFLGSKTVGTDIVLEFDFNRLNTFAAIYMEFQSVVVEQIDSTGVIYTEKIRGYRGCLSFSEYFYGGRKPRRRFVRTGLKWRPTSTLRFTFSGPVEIGTIAQGRAKDLGATVYGGSIEYESESKFKIDEISGYRTVLRYGSVRVLDATILFNTADFNDLSTTAEEIMDRNILWIPTCKDRFSDAITIGYIERFKIPMEKTKVSETQTRIVGGY